MEINLYYSRLIININEEMSNYATYIQRVFNLTTFQKEAIKRRDKWN